MLITWKEDGVEHSMTLAPEHEAIRVIPTKDSDTGKRDFAQVWIKNELSGSHAIVSDFDGLDVTGWMYNGAKISKSTYRIS